MLAIFGPDGFLSMSPDGEMFHGIEVFRALSL